MFDPTSAEDGNIPKGVGDVGSKYGLGYSNDSHFEEHTKNVIF